MLILVTGSRTWRDYQRIEDFLKSAEFNIDSVFDEKVEVVEGGQKSIDKVTGEAYGADYLTQVACRTLGVPDKTVNAEWGRWGKSAGPIRNRQMLDLKPDVVVAFWDGSSKGTGDCISEARKRGIEVIEILDKPMGLEKSGVLK